MKLSWIDFVLMAVTVVGCVSFMRVQSQLAELHREQSRLASTVGQMGISDAKLVHIKALNTQEPWQWAWRVYLPDNANGTLAYFVGSSGSGSHGFNGGPQEFIARVNITRLKDGRFGLYSRFTGGSSFSSFGSKEFCEFLTEHRDQLKIEQLGEDGKTQALSAGDPAVLVLRISLPDELARQATEKFGDDADKLLIPTVLDVKLELH